MTDLDLKAIRAKLKKLAAELREWQRALGNPREWNPDLVLKEIGGAATALDLEVPALCDEVERLRGEVAELTESNADLDSTCSSMVSARDLTIRDLRARIAELEAENMCDVCTGGHPIIGIPCMCGGSGKMSDAARYLREQLVNLEAKVQAERAEFADAYRTYAAETARLRTALTRVRAEWLLRGEISVSILDAALAPTPTGGNGDE